MAEAWRNSAYVAGVDGCRGGWLVVVREISDASTSTLLLCRAFEDVLALPQAPRIITVDIPIGLPERATRGGRVCDNAARAVLGGRQSSVFSVPARASVACHDYREACAVAFENSEPARRVSKQAFNLFGKIREVDRLMTSALQERVVECHPELAFWVLNGRQALDLPKKAKSKPNPAGLELRRGLLERSGYRASFLTSGLAKAGCLARDAGPDDFLDAAANASAAARIVRGEGVLFPDLPARDGKGLRMEIWG